jgi:N-6 DNA Methylase
MSKASQITEQWLETLGYDGSLGVIHRSADEIAPYHPYAREIGLMLQRGGEVNAAAVFEVDRVPTVCFLQCMSSKPLSDEVIEEVRRKIWNQNLVSIILVVDDQQAKPYPAARELPSEPAIALSKASASGAFSAAEVLHGDVQARLPDWFDAKNRVDHVLLENLGEAVNYLTRDDVLELEQAQLLLGKCIFVSFLEHRGIVGSAYRSRRGVGELLDLLDRRDGKGLYQLFKQLKHDFNGDLLEIEGGPNVDWRQLSDGTLELIAHFLRQTHLRTGQRSFWHYDFKHIPVELVSGIYESFLGVKQRTHGAVYTPRHLALLAVDEALRSVERPWEKTILDGACGSGILLTSAYRRIVGLATQAVGEQLSYKDRQDILLNCIRGGDISRAACKVTAFSLYLALLEDLAPSDITLLQDDQNVKLPPLLGKIIHAEAHGDFFSSKNLCARPQTADIVISNPPWFQAFGGEEDHSYETWWQQRFDTTLPRRQIALAFARRATDTLRSDGRLCLILPVAVLASNGIGPYLKDWFKELMPERIFNLSDMRFVLFPGAIHPTAMITGVRRSPEASGRIGLRETCEYVVPKADISLAFGRLTAHSVDRKRLHVQSLCDDAEILRTYFWGTQFDEELVARLSLLGTFGDVTDGEGLRFVSCKGFRMTDRSREPVSTKPLRHYPFLRTEIRENNYPKNHLFVSRSRLDRFPAELKELPRLGSKDNRAFKGARVLFPDGADNVSLQVRACFADEPFCFTDTIGALVDTESDSHLMQFVAAYLRSPLASYLLFYTAFSLTMERPHVKLAEIKRLPFVIPNDHKNPEKAHTIIDSVVDLLKPFRNGADIDESNAWDNAQVKVHKLIFDYFALTNVERRVVLDTCNYLIPSRQPSTLAGLRNALAQPANAADFQTYADTLRDELDSWRQRLRGEGHFAIEVLHEPVRLSGAMAVVKLSITDSSSVVHSPSKGHAVLRQLMDELRKDHSYPTADSSALSIASDFLVQHDGCFYFIKPMMKRLWLAPAAIHDAFRIVQTIRDNSSSSPIDR